MLVINPKAIELTDLVLDLLFFTLMSPVSEPLIVLVESIFLIVVADFFELFVPSGSLDFAFGLQFWFVDFNKQVGNLTEIANQLLCSALLGLAASVMFRFYY